jgi:hypothetical protein
MLCIDESPLFCSVVIGSPLLLCIDLEVPVTCTAYFHQIVSRFWFAGCGVLTRVQHATVGNPKWKV